MVLTGGKEKNIFFRIHIQIRVLRVLRADCFVYWLEYFQGNYNTAETHILINEDQSIKKLISSIKYKKNMSPLTRQVCLLNISRIKDRHPVGFGISAILFTFF